MRQLIPILLFTVCATNNPIRAQMNEHLSKDEVENLLGGNTIQGMNLEEDYTYRRYLDTEGRVLSKRKQKRRDGRWHVDKQGLYCTRWDQTDAVNCSFVVPLDGGGYGRVSEGKITHEFNVLEGNQFNN